MDHHGKLDYDEAFPNSCEHAELSCLKFSRTKSLVKECCDFVLGWRSTVIRNEEVVILFTSLAIPVTAAVRKFMHLLILWHARLCGLQELAWAHHRILLIASSAAVFRSKMIAETVSVCRGSAGSAQRINGSELSRCPISATEH